MAILVPAALALQPGQPVTLRQGEQTQPSRALRTAARLEAGGVRRVFLAVPEAAALGSTWAVDLEVSGRPAALPETAAATEDLGSRIRSRFAALGDTQLALEPREPPNDPPRFDDSPPAPRTKARKPGAGRR